MTEQLRNPWLVAAWPGAGNVAVAAARYLVETLPGVEPLGELLVEDHFDIGAANVAEGVVAPIRYPANRLYAWKDPAGVRDLLIFVGEAQPNERSHLYCKRVLDAARRQGAERAFTFAALVSRSRPEPGKLPDVHAIATSAELLAEVRLGLGLQTIEEGQVSGLNGVLLAAAASERMPAVGLLAEVPQLVANVPYLRAAQAVLSAFRHLAGIELDLTALAGQADALEQALMEMVRRIEAQVGDGPKALLSMQGLVLPKEAEEALTEGEPGEGDEPADEAPAEPPTGTAALSPEDLSAIEALFLRAGEDRSRALELKEVLDRHGVFAEYEDRFLDLFLNRGGEASGNA